MEARPREGEARARDSVGGLPERPRLRLGCCWFEGADGLVVRSVRGAFRVPPSHVEAMRTIFACLDGRHDYEAVLGAVPTETAFYSLRLLDSLAQVGMLGDGPAPAPAEQPVPTSPRLNGVRVAVLDDGLLATALTSILGSLGASVRHDDLAAAEHDGTVAVSAPDGPDLARLEAASAAARGVRTRWIACFPFGDASVVGPLAEADRPPCFACFELRWLGISPSIALERAYLAHLRNGGFREGAVATPQEAARLAALLAPLLVPRLARTSADRVALLDRETSETRERRLIGHPSCAVCASGPEDDALATCRGPWVDAPGSLSDLSDALNELAHEPCGIAAVVPPPRGAEPATGVISVSVARFALPDPDDVHGAQDNWCHGSAPEPEDARAIAIIEAIERYGGLSRPAPGVWTDYASIRADALDPRELPLFSPSQYAQPGFPFEPFVPDRATRWSWGYNVTRNRPQLVPTSAAWYGYDDELLGESSNGVAAHSSPGSALVHAALEAIERDAFMIHWLHRLSPPQLDVPRDASHPVLALIRGVKETGYELRLLDLTTDLGVPVVLAVAFRDDGRKPALLVGAGASLRPERALRHALRELYAATLSAPDSWILRPPLDPSDVRTLAQHRRAYEHPDWLPHASFLWASTRRMQLEPAATTDTGEDELAALVGRLAKHGHDVIGVDLTPRDVAPRDLFVVRAIAPGLQPLAIAPGPRLGGRRLYEAPVRMGYLPSPPREEDLNRVPHCFP